MNCEEVLQSWVKLRRRPENERAVKDMMLCCCVVGRCEFNQNECEIKTTDRTTSKWEIYQDLSSLIPFFTAHTTSIVVMTKPADRLRFLSCNCCVASHRLGGPVLVQGMII